MNESPDLQLLTEFALRKAEAPFAELVQRYLNLVHSAALRLVADRHLAEDVSQSVFVALAQQAPRVVDRLHAGAPLSGWLHLTTRHLAAKAVRTEVRRREREQVASVMQTQNTKADAAWEHLAPHLDHALADLSESDRHALLLRFFEGRTARQIGERLGLSEEAAQKRVGRALERMRERFALRGVTVSVATMTTLLGSYAVQGAPAALAAGVTTAAVAASLIPAVPAAAAAWSANLTTFLTMTKLQSSVLAGVILATAVPLTMQYRLLKEVQAGQRRPPPSIEAIPPATLFPAIDKTAAEAEEMDKLRREIEALRAQLAARPPGPARPALENERAGPTLLRVGQQVPFSDLPYAGTSTPAAAAQSFYALQREADLDGFLAMNLEKPHPEDIRMLAIQERREEMMAQLKAEMLPLQSVELVAQRPISENRTQLVLREYRTDGTVTNTLNLGRTARGWRLTL